MADTQIYISTEDAQNLDVAELETTYEYANAAHEAKTEESAAPEKQEMSERKRNFMKLPREDQRFYNFLHLIFNMASLAGFRIEGRIKVRDLKSGKTWE